MVRITVTGLLITLLASASIVPLSSATALPRPLIEIEAHDPELIEIAEWAVGRFEQAGLTLPDLTIVFPGRDLSLCNGEPGVALLNKRPIEVRVCWNSRFIVLHELAHAWDAHSLSEDLRAPFMALRTEVEAWTGQDVPWHQRGIEHAANVVAWGLLEDPFPISRTYPNDSASLTRGFTLLTGVEPLHDGGSPITIPDRSLYEGRANHPLERGR